MSLSIGVFLYSNKTRQGSLLLSTAFLSTLFTVCTALSTCPLLEENFGLLVS